MSVAEKGVVAWLDHHNLIERQTQSSQNNFILFSILEMAFCWCHHFDTNDISNASLEDEFSQGIIRTYF
jgi:hypothetical protein